MLLGDRQGAGSVLAVALVKANGLKVVRNENGQNIVVSNTLQEPKRQSSRWLKTIIDQHDQKRM